MISWVILLIKGTFMQIWESANLHLHIKIIWRRFHIKTLVTLWDKSKYDMWKVCFQTFRIKISQIWANNSKIIRIKKANFPRYCFFMNTNILEDFQICISVPFRWCSLFTIKKYRIRMFFDYEAFLSILKTLLFSP